MLRVHDSVRRMVSVGLKLYDLAVFMHSGVAKDGSIGYVIGYS